MTMLIRILVSAAAGVLLASSLCFQPSPPALAQQASLSGLGAVFRLNAGAIRDANQDGLADSVVARIIVPAAPAAADAEAAINIAARLGFETTALTLPLVVRDDAVERPAAIELPILIGRTNRFVTHLATAGQLDLTSLTPGQGLIAVVRSPLGGPDGVVVVGGDDAGTLAAGVELAARLPRLWSMTGVTLTGIERQVVDYLRSRAVAPVSAHVTGIIVDAERRGIATVQVAADMAAAMVPRAEAQLKLLDDAHRRGEQAGTLSFAEAASTTVLLAPGGPRAGRTVVRRVGMNSRTLTPPIDPDELLPEPTLERSGAPAPPPSAPAKPFDLTNVYSIDGWLADSYADLIPDRTDVSVIVADGREALAAGPIAARLGLESTGVSLPFTKHADKVREPATEPNPILVGRTNPFVQQLVKIGKARLDDLQAGEGVIQLVPRAFGNATATVVAGADASGSDAAGEYLGRRVPCVWDISRGAVTLDDVATHVSRFLSARTGAGQASQLVQELASALDELKNKTIESVEAKVYLEKAHPALDQFVAGQIRERFKDARVSATSLGVTEPQVVFEEKIDLPWEVDEFWSKLKEDVLPRIRSGSAVEVDARLSEPPEYRADLAKRVMAALIDAGAINPTVRIRSAYKQGFFWITEQVVSDLKGRNVSAIHVRVRAHKPDLTKKYKFYSVPSRWLHELYPADAVVERELGMPARAFTMELVDEAAEIYTLEATGKAGQVIYKAAFSPKFVEREYLDKFPGWSRVEVTTGWITASIDGRPVLDTRIQTDPERFWEYYQSKVLARVYDHTLKVTGGKPTADKQPFHRDLDVEVWMSEPDFRLGIDEELVTSLEALHDDIYFVTLDLFGAMGRTLTRQRLTGPGKILPIIHPTRTGQPAQVRVLYAGNASTRARLDLTYRERGTDKPVTISRDLTRIDTTMPSVVRVVVRAGGVRQIELLVEAANDKEAGRAADAFDGLARLQQLGLYRETLSYEHVDSVTVTIGVKEIRSQRTIRHTGVTSPSGIRVADGPPQTPIVRWDHVIGPDEAEEIVRKLAAFPPVKAYKVGESYRGRDLSALEITWPVASELVSVTKLTAYKPTILIMGRQHANEVSSTSHILRLAELLATDPAYRETLKKVNVILCPVMNPDGAQLAYELQKLTPTYCLHAGRYSALGMDVTSRTANLLPESEVEGRLWREWRPDIYLNPHGYPSHEWVQQFSGYVSPAFRSYWIARGWYTMLSGLRDPRYPEHQAATLAIREAIVREINSHADVRAMNLRLQARYRKWAYGFGPHLFGLEVYKDTAIYYTDPESGEPRGSRRAPTPPSGQSSRRASMGSWPQVTFMSGMTEAPDETAQGDWLALVATAGFSFLTAHVNYLRDGQYAIERIEEAGGQDGSALTMLRVRPVRPPQPRATADQHR